MKNVQGPKTIRWDSVSSGIILSPKNTMIGTYPRIMSLGVYNVMISNSAENFILVVTASFCTVVAPFFTFETFHIDL